MDLNGLLMRVEGELDCIGGNTLHRTISVDLEEEDLWNKFNAVSNEMIVTKSGRRMFPVVKVSIRGLDPRAMYSIALEFVQMDNCRWKFSNGRWVPGGKAEIPSHHSLYIHPESPNFGAHWTKEPVSFSKVKLTNKYTVANQVVLNSLHKYEPRVHIIRVGTDVQEERVFTFTFPETRFIAVTAYQNEDVTALKIKYNPFAKAFLDVRDRSENGSGKMTPSPDCSQASYPQYPMAGWYISSNVPSYYASASSQPLPTNSIGFGTSPYCDRLSLLRNHRSLPYPAAAKKSPSAYQYNGYHGLESHSANFAPRLEQPRPMLSQTCPVSNNPASQMTSTIQWLQQQAENPPPMMNLSGDLHLSQPSSSLHPPTFGDPQGHPQQWQVAQTVPSNSPLAPYNSSYKDEKGMNTEAPSEGSYDSSPWSPLSQ